MSDQENLAINTKYEAAIHALNREGHGFQHAVLKESERLVEAHKSRWLFEVSELPVVVGQKTTRIDFLLRHAGKPLYLVAECKRVDPAFGWCFARASYVRRDYDENEVIVDGVDPGGGPFKRTLHHSSERVFHVGLPFNTGGEGDSSQGRRNKDLIEEAATQAFLGVGGLMAHFRTHPELLDGSRAVIVPAIFTTASLVTVSGDLSDASLDTGHLPTGTQVRQADWLWLRYNVSPLLKPEPTQRGPEADLPPSLSRFLDTEFARTVAIVGPNGIGSFLAATMWHL